MVDRQIASRGIAHKHVVDAMRDVPRQAFPDPALAAFACEDTLLPIAANCEGQGNGDTCQSTDFGGRA